MSHEQKLYKKYSIIYMYKIIKGLILHVLSIQCLLVKVTPSFSVLTMGNLPFLGVFKR